MTVSNSTCRTSATGSGSTGQVVPFSFPISATTDIVVKTRVTATGVESTLTENSDYSVTITGDSGGSITTITSIPSTSSIWIVRITPGTQTLDLVAGGTFNAENVEDAFDKTTKLANEAKEQSIRSIRLPDTDDETTCILPSSVDRAGKYLSFDANGNPTATSVVTPSTSITVGAFGATLVTEPTASQTRSDLGLGDAATKTIDTNGSLGTSDTTISSQKAVKTYVDALGTTIVALTGNQTVAGIKTFTSSPVVPTPTTDYQTATKKYVDDSSVSGKVVQVVNYSTATCITGTTAMSYADTIPQNTEGNQFLSVAITPTSATNSLKIEVTAQVSHSVNGLVLTAALFQDSNANAISAISSYETQTTPTIMRLSHYMTAGTTSETTFYVRIGGTTGSTTTFNGVSGLRKLGGVGFSSITVTEIR